MSFIDSSKANIAYKLALGKIHTNNGRESFNEPESTVPVSMGQFAWAQALHPYDPDDASNIGVISNLLTLTLGEVSGTDGTGVASAWYCYLPAVLPVKLTGKINPRTGVAYVGGDRVGNLIPASAGPAYRPRIFSGASEITALDASDWFIDCFAGVLTQESDVPASMVAYGTTGTVQAYVYIGDTVSEALKKVKAIASATTFYDKCVVGDGIVGAMDGTNRVFTIQVIPDTNSEHLYLNGVLLRAGAGFDYTLVGNTITIMEVWPAPEAADSLSISYRKTA